MKNKKTPRFRLADLKDSHLCSILAAICVAGRLPFYKTFELVAYDGTYYLNQAKTIFSGHMAGAFPIGYPFVVKIFQVFLRDYQLAGQVVSFLAGIGSTIVLYCIARRFVRREIAFLGALLLALNPLAARLSLMTLSESLYIFWVLLGLLMFLKQRYVLFGLLIGMAAITRPEAVAIAGLLGISRIKKPKQIVLIAASFLAVYAVNSVILSVNSDRVVILPKSNFFGTSAGFWKQREASIDFEGKEETYKLLESEAEQKGVWQDYLERLPRDLWLVVRHVFPAVFLLALFNMRRKKFLFLLTALVSFFVYPLVTVRSDDRYIFPYVPILILYAVLALDADALRNKTLRSVAIGLLAVTIVVLPVVNSAQLLAPEEPNLLGMKRAGIAYRDQIDTNDKIASRKPFFAFYAGGKYVEIPVAPYEDVMTYLGERDVKYLALHQQTIHALRPALRPLLYHKMAIDGELRFRQTYFSPTGEIVYTRVRDSDPLRWNRLTPPGGADVSPSWSPDGTRIVFRSKTADGTGGIYVIAVDATGGSQSPAAGRPMRIVEAPFIYDQLSWSPDGARIAYASYADGDTNVYFVELATGNVGQVTFGAGTNMSPSWSPDGQDIVFCSKRSGQKEIWRTTIGTGEATSLTGGGGNAFPAVSPTGEMIAWIKENRGVAMLHAPTGRILQLRVPSIVAYAPAWSPDSRYIAVTASDWGSWDIYLLKTDGTGGLLLTKNPRRDAMPSWSPDGRSIALISDKNERTLSIWVVDGLEPYFAKLGEPSTAQTLSPPR